MLEMTIILTLVTAMIAIAEKTSQGSRKWGNNPKRIF